jgi:AhpD family alkylhydroperoxidase
MARLPYVEREDVAESDGDWWRETNSVRLLMHRPRVRELWRNFATWSGEDCELPPLVRELVILQVAVVTGCVYPYAVHLPTALSLGATADEIRAITGGSADGGPTQSPLTRAALRVAHDLARDRSLSDEVFEAARLQLGDDALVDLLQFVTGYVSVGLLLRALNTDIDDRYQTALDELPFPAAFA